MATLPSYATVAQVEAGFRPLTTDEASKCEQLIVEAGVMIDAAAPTASADIKCIVTCRMVRRALADSGIGTPIGTTQGTVSALGYSQTWTLGSGSTGELYIGKSEKTLLGVSNKIGSSNPFSEVNNA